MSISITSGGSLSILSGGSVRINASVVPFNPNSLPGLVSWYDASAISGVANGGPVNSWSDSSTSGYTLTKASSGAASPAYLAADALLGGQPSVQFVRGASSALSLRLALAGTSLPVINAPRTVYVAGYLSTPSAGGSQGCFGYGVDTTVAKLQFSNNGDTGLFGVDFGYLKSGAGTLAANVGFVAAYPYSVDISLSPLYLNGVAFSSVSANAIRTGTDGGGLFDIVMGSTVTYSPSPEILANWGGALAETLIYDTAHDPATRVLIENYLAAKYSITL